LDTFAVKSLSELITPACLIDIEKMQQNCERMQTHVASRALGFRPHVKTLRSIAAASLYAPSTGPITVSTLAEAKGFANAGYQDILYAVGITPNKFNHLNSLLAITPLLTVCIDSVEGAGALSDFAHHFQRPLSVVIEIDVDAHRAGLTPHHPDVIRCADIIATTEQLNFRGIMAHAGASYDAFSASAQRQIAEQECTRIHEAAQQLKQAGFPCAMVSAGSTPTALADIQHTGITELRAGVYATFDCVMAGLGVCDYEHIALSVLTSVIGHQPDKGWVIVDAGWMALSRDLGTAGQTKDCGYGLVCDARGQLLPGWYVVATNQEHGILVHKDGLAPEPEHFGYGSLLRILPIHACATAAQFEQYWITRDNQYIEDSWPRIQGW
jgi:D-serine deaminase-like pyridoxal phosphate-dependent protein